MLKINSTFKTLCLVMSFSLVIALSIINATPLYNQNCVVSLNSSSGEFYTAKKCAIKDCFLGNGISKTYPINYDYLNEMVKPINATLVKAEEVDGITNYYYYSPNLARRVVVNGKEINLHVAISSNTVTVGYPLIFNGY